MKNSTVVRSRIPVSSVTGAEYKKQLQVYLKRYRWAFEELTYDVFCAQENVLVSDGLGAVSQYLKDKLQREGVSKRVTLLKALRSVHRETGDKLIPVNFHSYIEVKDRLAWYRRNQAWVFDVMLMRIKRQEALEACGKGSGMVRLLDAHYGSMAGLLGALNEVIRRGGRRKTLWMEAED